MRRLLSFDPSITLLLICVLVFISEPIAAQRTKNPTPTPLPNPGMGTNTSHSFSVSGMVFDAESHTSIDGVRVDLRAFTGGTVGTAFTSGNGNFQFNNIPGGSYEIVVEQAGYQSA